jgi:hypothetical protein
MKAFSSRQVIHLFVAFAVGAGSLSVAEPAPAAKALFRVERKFYGAPFPAKTSPGGAGVRNVYVEPYTSNPPATATVASGNPIGSPFTLPSAFIDFQGTYTRTAKTAYVGKTTMSFRDYYNGEARFGPNNGAVSPTRVVFPTTGGNTAPNVGAGFPTSPTTTFSGRYDFYRAGSLNILPGPNRFGGTMRLFHLPTATRYQYIYYYSPALYKGYGSFRCQRAGIDCTVLSTSGIGDITSSGMGTRFLISFPGGAKYTTSTGNGSYPTPSGNKSFVTAKTHRLNLVHPWTTGSASAYNYLSWFRITPQDQGYDISLSGADITITHVFTSVMFNKTLSAATYAEITNKQFLKGVTRVVSMVRPRLTHAYLRPIISLGDPNFTNFQAARLETMKVFFLPEPTGALMLAAGIAVLAELGRRRIKSGG